MLNMTTVTHQNCKKHLIFDTTEFKIVRHWILKSTYRIVKPLIDPCNFGLGIDEKNAHFVNYSF